MDKDSHTLNHPPLALFQKCYNDNGDNYGQVSQLLPMERIYVHMTCNFVQNLPIVRCTTKK
jgi:hypothetical protein